MGAISRRLLTVPLYTGLASIAVLAVPLWIPVLALVDAARSGTRAALRCGLFFTYYLLCEVAGLAAGFALWLLGLSPGVGRRRYLGWNYALQGLWAAALWYGSFRIFSVRVEVEGSEAIPPAPLLLLLRHASIADTLIPAILVTRAHGIRLRYVMKRELLWDPCLDVVGNRIPNYFVDRQAVDGERERLGVAGLARGLGTDEGVLLYPEGTRFTPAKRLRILTRLSESGDPALLERAKRLEHTLPPRLGGALALLDACPETPVVFCAHTGLENAGTFWNLWNGALVRATVRVRFWRVAYDEIPESREDRAAWLYDQWLRVDQWIAEHAPEVERA